MASVSIKHRSIGAAAIVGPRGHPVVTSRTDGKIEVVTGASAEGFNPLDLMCASLSSCLALSGRISASRLGLLENLIEIYVSVSLEKTHEEPFRVTRFFCEFAIDGEFTESQKMDIAHMAEEICTVSNTLKAGAEIALEVA
jgi:uncharacterized OsmC-like protein